MSNYHYYKVKNIQHTCLLTKKEIFHFNVDYLYNTVVPWAAIASLMDGGVIAFVVSMQSVCNLQSGSLQNIDSRSMDPLELGHGSFSKGLNPLLEISALNT